MIGVESQTKPQKTSKRFYVILALAILLIAILLGTVIYELTTADRVSFGSGPIGVEVIADKPFFLQGELVNFTIYLDNRQNCSVGPVCWMDCRIEKDSQVVCSVSMNMDYPVEHMPTFPANTRTVCEHWSWNQKMSIDKTLVQAQPGNYILTIRLDGPNFGDNDIGSCTFEIR